METLDGALTPSGDGVGFSKPTKRKVVKATTIKRVIGKGAVGKNTRSSLVAKAQALSMRDLARLREELVELSKRDEKQDADEATEVDQSTPLGLRFSAREFKDRRGRGGGAGGGGPLSAPP